MNKEHKTVQLDAFLAEILGEGIVINMYGHDWTLQPEIPALFMLRLQQEMSNELEQIPFDREMDLLRSLLKPPSQVEEMLNLGLSPTAFTILLRVALAAYSGQDPNETIATLRQEQEALREARETVENLGKEEELPKGKTPSSNTGATSKRTSSGTTRSARKTSKP
jgi:hypothetical protein